MSKFDGFAGAGIAVLGYITLFLVIAALFMWLGQVLINYFIVLWAIPIPLITYWQTWGLWLVTGIFLRSTPTSIKKG